LDQIESGWNPAQPREHTIHIGDPLSGVGSPGQAHRPWWRFW